MHVLTVLQIYELIAHMGIAAAWVWMLAYFMDNIEETSSAMNSYHSSGFGKE